jgi:hypothetical protein
LEKLKRNHAEHTALQLLMPIKTSLDIEFKASERLKGSLKVLASVQERGNCQTAAVIGANSSSSLRSAVCFSVLICIIQSIWFLASLSACQHKHNWLWLHACRWHAAGQQLPVGMPHFICRWPGGDVLLASVESRQELDTILQVTIGRLARLACGAVRLSKRCAVSEMQRHMQLCRCKPES